MSDAKIKITTIILTGATLFLLGSAVYVGRLIITDNQEVSSIVPQKTKAANVTYSKLIALNTVPIGSDRDTPSPTLELTSIITQTGTPQTPTPTEIILAYSNPSITGDASNEAQISVTTASAKVKDLPDAGFIYNGLIIFAAATLLVFFSFLF